MARYDKFQSLVSGPRAALAFDTDTTAAASSTPPGAPTPDTDIKLGVVTAVSLDASGHLIPTAAGTEDVKVVGVLVITRKMYAGDIVDIMDLGEIVEFDDPAAPGSPSAAGTSYYADVTAGLGGLTTTAAGNVFVGYTIEANRLRVRF